MKKSKKRKVKVKFPEPKNSTTTHEKNLIADCTFLGMTQGEITGYLWITDDAFVRVSQYTALVPEKARIKKKKDAYSRVKRTDPVLFEWYSNSEISDLIYS